MAEAPRNQLPSGYDEDFVNAVEDEVLCLICRLILKEPVQTRCGHRFCKECLEEHFRRQEVRYQRSTCPAEREGLDRDRDVFPDKATERKILSFVIKCPSDGCEWTGELRNKEIHLASCLFKVIPCTNENCHVTVQRKELEQHVTVTCQWKIIKCDHCSEPHPELLMQVHIEQCSKFPVSCPNSCGCSVPREMIPYHIGNDCSLSIIPCPYVEMGCEMEVRRREVDSHLHSSMKIHLHLACVKLRNTEVKLKETQETSKTLMEKLETLRRRFEEKVISDEKNVFNEKIVMNKRETPSDFPWIFIWKIENFSEILRKAKTREKKLIGSAPFYTEKYGYKLKLLMYPNGNGPVTNTHLSVYIVVMKGEYDAILPWPFNKDVKFTVIDQQEHPGKRENFTRQWFADNATSFQRPTEEENVRRGITQFISHEKLDSNLYIVDDTLFLQVEIGSSFENIRCSSTSLATGPGGRRRKGGLNNEDHEDFDLDLIDFGF